MIHGYDLDGPNRMGPSVNDIRCRILLGRYHGRSKTRRRVFSMLLGAWGLGIAIGLILARIL